MCDFPNVENNDFELDALGSICDDWSRRIASLQAMFDQGFQDEALVLCGCYIEAIGRWLFKSDPSGEEAFAKALVCHGGNEVFSRINPKRLMEFLRRDRDADRHIISALSEAFAGFQDGFHPFPEIISVCESALSDEPFVPVDEIFWPGTLACAAYRITRCEGIQNGSVEVKDYEGAVLDFEVFHPALKRIFEKARAMVVAGRLRIY